MKVYRGTGKKSRGAGRTKGKLNDRDAKCPFFCAHTRQAVICESPIPGSRLKINFGDNRDKDDQYRIFCCGRYENCELYQPNQAKYEEA